MKLSKLASAITLSATVTASFLPTAAAKPARPYGDVQVLATFPTPPGFPEGIAVIDSSGAETGRLANPAGSPFPYDSPANIAFDGHGSLLVSNHAFATGNPANFTVLDVYVGDKGSPLSKPGLP